MTTTRKTYQHVCPAARALEAVGDKWSLLIVRDLLPGEQRFTDLLNSLAGITPKWLTLRLRELEGTGIVARDQQAGRREVWYRLTAKGRDLAGVLDALSMWGLEHAMRAPLPDEPVHPAQTTTAVAAFFNKRGIRLPAPVAWMVRFGAGRSWTVRFDGDRWAVERGESEADVTVDTTPDIWVAFLMAAPSDRRLHASRMQFQGEPAKVDELIATFGWKQFDLRTLGPPSPAPSRRKPAPV